MSEHRTPTVFINLAAYERNLRRIASMCSTSKIMAVVKADAYGHGLVEISRAAEAAGADMLGVLDIETGLELREHGIFLPLFAWLHSAQSDFAAAIDAGIELSVSTVAELSRIANAGFATVHLKIDTGLNRNGATASEWPELLEVAERLQTDGRIKVAAVWSHLADAGNESDEQAVEAFDHAWQLAQQRGLGTFRHLASSPSAFALPRVRYEMVRIGISAFGVSPVEGTSREALELEAVMTLVANSSRDGELEIGYEHGLFSSLASLDVGSYQLESIGALTTKVETARAGELFELFGATTDVQKFADHLNTVPDEIFAGLWALPKHYLSR